MGLKEKKAIEGTEERKETGVQSGQRGNLASPPALEVECVEKRYDVMSDVVEGILV